jgi:hypothetical protein
LQTHLVEKLLETPLSQLVKKLATNLLQTHLVDKVVGTALSQLVNKLATNLLETLLKFINKS